MLPPSAHGSRYAVTKAHPSQMNMTCTRTTRAVFWGGCVTRDDGLLSFRQLCSICRVEVPVAWQYA